MARSWLMAAMMLNDGSYTELVALIDEILPDVRRLEHPSRTGLLLMGRGIAYPHTTRGLARADFEEAVAITRDAGDPLALGYIRAHYGSFLSLDGDVARARALHEEMHEIACSLGDTNLRAEAHYDLAMDAMSAGDPEPAEPHLVAAVSLYRLMGHLDGLTRCLGALSALAVKRGHWHLAARLIGATAAARASIGLTPWPAVAEAEQRTIDQAEARLPSGEFAAQTASGRGQAMEGALTQALLLLQREQHQRLHDASRS
jgi:hypothetical protein